MKSINIIGYGSLSKQIASFLRQHYPNISVFFFDDNFENEQDVFPFMEYCNHINTAPFIIGLGYKHFQVKTEISNNIKQKGGQLFSFAHSTAFINPTAILEKGSVVYPLGNIDKNVIIGENCLLNNSVVVSHDSRIGDNCYLSPASIISGNVTIGKNCFIGTGALISNSISIGNNVTIAIGTVVTKSIPDNSSVIGNPMTFTKNPLRLL